jgi:hypothetical protein
MNSGEIPANATAQPRVGVGVLLVDRQGDPPGRVLRTLWFLFLSCWRELVCITTTKSGIRRLDSLQKKARGVPGGSPAKRERHRGTPHHRWRPKVRLYKFKKQRPLTRGRVRRSS